MLCLKRVYIYSLYIYTNYYSFTCLCQFGWPFNRMLWRPGRKGWSKWVSETDRIALCSPVWIHLRHKLIIGWCLSNKETIFIVIGCSSSRDIHGAAFQKGYTIVISGCSLRALLKIGVWERLRCRSRFGANILRTRWWQWNWGCKKCSISGTASDDVLTSCTSSSMYE